MLLVQLLNMIMLLQAGNDTVFGCPREFVEAGVLNLVLCKVDFLVAEVGGFLLTLLALLGDVLV